MSVLPEDIVWPNFRPLRQMNLDDHMFFKIIPQHGKVAIETEKSSFYIEDIDDLFDLAEMSRNCMTIASAGTFDSLLLAFGGDKRILSKLDFGFLVTTAAGNIKYFGSLIILYRGDKRFYIWNLRAFFKITDKEMDLLNIPNMRFFVYNLFEYFRKMGVEFSGLFSPAFVSRGLFLDSAGKEFRSNNWNRDMLKAFYESCYGGRQESVGLGTVNVYNYDMRNAHLNIIRKMPSIRNCRYFYNADFIDDCVYGAYLINVDIPEMNLCPLPYVARQYVKSELFNSARGYPYGEVYGWYGKDYLELLDSMNIKYNIIESHQFVLIQEEFPFKMLSDRLFEIIMRAPWFFNVKSLYHSISGSAISVQTRVNEATKKPYPSVYSTFSPMFYSYILSQQSVSIYKMFMDKPGSAVRSDAISINSLLSAPEMRLENKGSTTFINSLLKVFPDGNGKTWLDLINENLHSNHFIYNIEKFPRVNETLYSSKELGIKSGYSQRIFPSHGIRLGSEVKELKELLNSWISSVPPSVDLMDKGWGLNQIIFPNE